MLNHRQKYRQLNEKGHCLLALANWTREMNLESTSNIIRIEYKLISMYQINKKNSPNASVNNKTVHFMLMLCARVCSIIVYTTTASQWFQKGKSKVQLYVAALFTFIHEIHIYVQIYAPCMRLFAPRLACSLAHSLICFMCACLHC